MTDQLESLLPRPTSAVAGAGEFVLTADTPLVVAGSAAAAGDAADAVRTALSGLPLALPPGGDRAGIVVTVQDDLPAEGYRLTVDVDQIRVAAGSPAGAFYAGQTLRQLLPDDAWRTCPPRWERLPVGCCKIADAPQLAWRGAMLDVARRFFPKRAVLRLIDLLAMHKLNRLHLHLTDDQGWRIESHRFPELVERASHRPRTQLNLSPDERVYDGVPHGGYYSLADLAEIARYARQRAITVVPEIDVPGHSTALLAARPELAARPGARYDVWPSWDGFDGTLSPLPDTVQFLDEVFGELLEAIPTPYVHIGGDECNLAGWEANPRIADYRRRLGLAGPVPLLAHFVRQLADRLAERGCRVVAWDEAFVSGGLRPDSVVMAWRGERVARRAARAGHDVVMTPIVPTYLNCYAEDDPREPLAGAGPIRLTDLAGFRPVPAGWERPDAARVLGTQFLLWTPLIPDERMLDYLAFPRGSLLAEAAWSGQPEPWPALRDRLERHLGRLDAAGVEYRPLSGPRPWQEGGTGWLQFRRGLSMAALMEHHDVISDRAEAPTEPELRALVDPEPSG